MWRRTWLLFSQAVTIALAVVLVLDTLAPAWLPPRWRAPIAAPLPPPSLVPPLHPPERPAAAAATDSTPAAAIAAAPSLAPAARRAAPAVVSILTRRATRTAALQTGLGSGVLVAPEGYLLTNNHVVEAAGAIEVQLADGRSAAARLIGTDPETDLALLKVDLPDLPALAFGNLTALQVGDTVLAIGNPFNVGQTVTAGIVSALGRQQLGLSTYENFIQTDAAINPGNSGGALVDGAGNLVGINTAIFSRGGGSLGIGFAIPADTAQQVMQGLLRDGQVRRGWIGIEPRELTPELAQSLGLPMQPGVLVTGVLAGGPAGSAGLRPGDVVLRVDATPVQTTSALLAAVAALQPGATTTLALQRGERLLAMQVQVAQRPRPALPRRR